MNTKARGIRYLAGSVFGQDIPKPAQKPPIPTHQLQPSQGQLRNAAKTLGIPEKSDPKHQRYVTTLGRVTNEAPPPMTVPPPLRKLLGLSRQDVLAVLNKPGVLAIFDKRPHELEIYRQAAMRNLSMADLAKRLGVKNERAAEIYLDYIERDILVEAIRLGYIKDQPTPDEKLGALDKRDDQKERWQDADVKMTRGRSIGGNGVRRGRWD